MRGRWLDNEDKFPNIIRARVSCRCGWEDEWEFINGTRERTTP